MSTRVLGLMFALAVLASAGCLGSALDGGKDGGAGSDAGAMNMEAAVSARFYSDVAPIIKPACGACHGVQGGAGPAFMLAQPDMLQNLLLYPGLIGDTPETSRLYMKGQHEGPGFTPDQAPIVHDWIVFYNQSRAASSDGGTAPPKPQVMPFLPMMGASNTMDLSQVDPKFAGQTITFTPSLVGSSLELSQITVVAAPTMGIHIAHPLFVLWDGTTPTPDPVDSFSNVDETVAAGSKAPLGPGLLILPNYKAGQNINVVFAVIETKAGGSDGGTTLACKATAMFTANVKPLLTQNTCTTQCHVGANPTAGLKLDATPDATLCANLLGEINTTTPAQSQLLLQPDPAQNNGHPKKINPITAFSTAVTNWINAEK